METIISLSKMAPRRFERAGMMIIIVFLAGGWVKSDMRYIACEREKTDLIKAHAIETISFYNRIIEGQTKRQDKLDSGLSEVNKLIDVLTVELKKKKR